MTSIYIHSVSLFILLDMTQSLHQIVCYYENWAQYHTYRQLIPYDIDPFLCTQLNFAFAYIDTNHRINQIEKNDKVLYRQTVALKDKNPELKVLLAIGGFRMNSTMFTSMLATWTSRNVFIQDSISYLREYQFDGLNIDWEIPEKDMKTGDKQRFTLLCQELYSAYVLESVHTGQERLLLTAAVSPHKKTIDMNYEPAMLNKYLDYINVMSYDYNGGWSAQVGHNAPLYNSESVEESVSYAANYWVQQGVSRNKLIIGIPAYGIAWYYSSRAWVYTKTIDYANICLILNTTESTSYQQITSKSREKQWISYENKALVAMKCQFIKNERFGGAMIWALSKDDHSGLLCNQGKFPLHKAMSNCLRDSYKQQSPHHTTVTSTSIYRSASYKQQPSHRMTVTSRNRHPSLTTNYYYTTRELHKPLIFVILFTLSIVYMYYLKLFVAVKSLFKTIVASVLVLYYNK